MWARFLLLIIFKNRNFKHYVTNKTTPKKHFSTLFYINSTSFLHFFIHFSTSHPFFLFIQIANTSFSIRNFSLFWFFFLHFLFSLASHRVRILKWKIKISLPFFDFMTTTGSVKAAFLEDDKAITMTACIHIYVCIRMTLKCYYLFSYSCMLCASNVMWFFFSFLSFLRVDMFILLTASFIFCHFTK